MHYIWLNSCIDENLDGYDDLFRNKPALSFGKRSDKYYDTPLVIKFKVLEIQKSDGTIVSENSELMENIDALRLIFILIISAIFVIVSLYINKKSPDSEIFKKIMCIWAFIFFSIVALLFIFFDNSLHIGLFFFSIMIGVVSLFMPSKDKNLKIKAFLIMIFLVIFPTTLAWFQLDREQPYLPEPDIGLVPQVFRKNGVDYNLKSLDYTNDTEELDGLTFNSMFFIRSNLSLIDSRSVVFFAELKPLDVPTTEKYPDYKYLKTRIFHSGEYKGPCRNKVIYFEIDLNKAEPIVLPGLYKLKVYYIERHWLNLGKVSKIYTYDLKIEKDEVFFNPLHSRDPISSSRRGCIYSVRNSDVIGWDNRWEAYLENNLGDPISGTVSLYITEREGFKPVFKKVENYKVKNGRISYKTTSRSQ